MANSAAMAAAMNIRVFANVADLKKALAEGTTAITTTTGAMEKLSSSLKGDGLIAQATKVTAAIGGIENVSQFTATEAQKHFNLISKAIEKAALTGRTLPPEIHATADALKERLGGSLSGVEKGLDKIWGGLKSAAGLIGVTFTAGAVVNFTSRVFDAASAIHDQSTALGLSAEAYQRYKFAAEQSGSSAEAFTRAVGVLNEKLGTGDTSTVAALKTVGKSLDDMRAMKPEDVWLELTKAVAAIEDPFLRAQVGQDLFGKGFRELLPGMLEGYDKLGKAATVMSDETVKRLEAAQDSWDAFWNSVVIHSGEVIASLMDTSNRGAGSMGVLAAGYAGTTAAVVQQAEESRKAALGLKDVHLAAEKVTPVIKVLTEEEKKAAAEAKRHAEQLAAVASQYTQKGLNAQTKAFAERLAEVTRQGGFTTEGLKRFGKELDDFVRKGGTLTGELHEIQMGYAKAAFNAQIAAAGTDLLTRGLERQSRATLGSIPPMVTFNLEMDRLIRLSQAGVGPVALQNLDKFGTKVKALPAPPVAPWQDFALGVRGVVGDLMDLFTDTADAFSRLGRDFVSTVLDTLVPGLGMLVELAWPVIQKGLEKIWQGVKAFAGAIWNALSFGSAPRDSQQDVQTDPSGRVIYDPSDPNNPNPGGFDPGNPWQNGDMGASGGDNGQFSFAHGTGGRFLDFGAGTPVVLHGRERVQTEREARAEAPSEHNEGFNHVLATLQNIERLLRTQALGQRDAALLMGVR